MHINVGSFKNVYFTLKRFYNTKSYITGFGIQIKETGVCYRLPSLLQFPVY